MQEDLDRQIEKAEVRYKERSLRREKNIRDIQNPNVTPFKMTTDERVRERMKYLGIKDKATSVKAIKSVEDLERVVEEIADPVKRIALERIVGTNNLMPSGFLRAGAAAAEAIGRVQIKYGGIRKGFGTGFLVDERLLLTNNHVLPHFDFAADSKIEMNFEEDFNGQSQSSVVFDLDPDHVYITNERLDYTLVGVKPTNKSGASLSKFGYIPLLAGRGKILVGELINIVQHPGGEAKQLAMRENRLIDLFDNFLHYETDTAAGSSGACLFNDQWIAIGLHHAGVSRKDKEGRTLKKNGKVWEPGDSEDSIDYFANEGIRLSSILFDINRQAKTMSKAVQENVKALLSRAGELPQLSEKDVIDDPEAIRRRDDSGTPRDRSIPHIIRQSHDYTDVPSGGKSIVIPVNINVSFSGGKPSKFKTRTTRSAGMEESLRELERFGSREYFNEDHNEANKESYYSNIDFDQRDSEVLAHLSELLKATHTNKPSYSPGKHLYPWVDLYKDGSLRSVYTEDVYAAEDWIREFFAIEEEILAKREEMISIGKSSAQADLEAQHLEDARGYNCEHSVPQNWFGKKEPMRGDLHHLFACEMQANSFRSNYPFYDFEEFENPDQLHESSKLKDGWGMADPNVGFEPYKGKGIVARASLYFLARYPGVATSKFRVPMLLRWHEAYPAQLFELHRNEAIFEKQGNRNPFIDFPDLAARLMSRGQQRDGERVRARR